VDDDFRMRVDELAAAIASDRAAGQRPFLVVANAGTTNTGAIDPLPAIATLCAENALWLHVDAAYGGAFVLSSEGRRRLAGIAAADSITLDPHKGLFLPYGTGCLLARDGEALRRAHDLGADYLQDLGRGRPPRSGSAETTWSPAALGPELSRDFRGLRLWLPLMLHGAGAFRDALDEKLALAERLTASLERLIAGGTPLEIVARPQLSTAAFRLRRAPDEPLEGWNRRNITLLTAVNRRNRVHLSSTLLPAPDGPAFTLRACILSFRTHARHVDWCLEDLAQSCSDLAV
jgi:aromatic-L-amino-acid/L-tryptophan decarboxylase